MAADTALRGVNDTLNLALVCRNPSGGFFRLKTTAPRKSCCQRNMNIRVGFLSTLSGIRLGTLPLRERLVSNWTPYASCFDGLHTVFPGPVSQRCEL